MNKGNLKAVSDSKTHVLPDVAHDMSVAHQGTLDRVGMSLIEVPVRIQNAEGDPIMLAAKADAYVNLIDPKAKGIHMSRLFLALQKRLEIDFLTPALIEDVLTDFVRTHAEISDSASLSISFEYLVRRKALLSDNSAWRTYPVNFRGSLTRGAMRLETGVSVAYSSTCPCSAALARQLIQEKLVKDFSSRGTLSFEEMKEWIVKESSILATPHSQRSYADVKVVVDRAAEPVTLVDLIDSVEGVLKTAVQAAVKREDEQEFARLNGQNTMFCEDAARRMKFWLESQKKIVDYRIEARHVESLHPHDAVSIVTKGVEGGFRP
ncbi:MAG: GTP cyclohydrolase FolE2 [Bdellovibrionota bacterium]